jgi:hypothetical protein
MTNCRSLLASLALLATVGVAGSAHANATGYVCQSAWLPNPAAFASYLNNMGAFGVVYTYVYSGPKCTGTQTGMAYFCTTGATNATWCALGQLMTERQAATLAGMLQAAGAASQKVTLYTVGGANAGGYVELTQP